MDPTGNHALVSLTNGQNFYVNAKSTKATALAKFKVGLLFASALLAFREQLPLVCGCVAGLHDRVGRLEQRAGRRGQVCPRAFESNRLHFRCVVPCRSHSTKRILLGTTKGAIYEALLEDNKDKICKKLYDLNEPDSKEPQPISGLRIELFPHRAETDPDKFFVMAATPNRHYQARVLPCLRSLRFLVAGDSCCGCPAGAVHWRADVRGHVCQVPLQPGQFRRAAWSVAEITHA